VENWKLRLTVNFIDNITKDYCYLCGDTIEGSIVQISSEKPSKLILDLLCFEQLTALGIKSLYGFTPSNKEI